MKDVKRKKYRMFDQCSLVFNTIRTVRSKELLYQYSIPPNIKNLYIDRKKEIQTYYSSL